MQSKSAIAIRRSGVSKTNRLVRAARHIETLTPAFEEWQRGEIYVCSKKHDYRYRFGDRSKSTASWSSVAVQLFATPAEFAFAAMVLGPEQSTPSKKALISADVPAPRERLNVIQLAGRAA